MSVQSSLMKKGTWRWRGGSGLRPHRINRDVQKGERRRRRGRTSKCNLVNVYSQQALTSTRSSMNSSSIYPNSMPHHDVISNSMPYYDVAHSQVSLLLVTPAAH